VLVKAPAGADVPTPLRAALAAVGTREGVSFAPDVDPIDMM
jgi:hypothetical protein